MKHWHTKLLSAAAAVAMASSAYGLTIVPTFDTSITSSPNASGMTNAILGAIRVLQSNITDNVTVQITYVADESVGLGESSTFGGDYAYSDFLSALRTHAASVNDTNALSKLPSSSTDPVIGGSQIHLTTPQARLLGLDTYNGIDSTISFKMSLMNFTRPPSNPNKYDLQQVAEHEMDEVLGISSGLPDTSEVWPVDLFRYTTNLARTFTTSGDNAYFSIDGTNLLARYNMNSTGDYGDWWSYYFPTNWSPVTGITLHYAQVQDAFSGPDTALDVGKAELTALDVVGWTLVTTTTTASGTPKLKIVRTGVNQYTLSWSNIYSSYVLQERTNLIAGVWVASVSGSTNPAVVISTNAAKFYRLFSSTGSFIVTQTPNALVAPKNVSVYPVIRNYRPRAQ